MELPDGIVVVVKHDCPTCVVVEPVLGQLAAELGDELHVFSQDDPSFPSTVPDVGDDTGLDLSWRLELTTVPTLIKVEHGKELERLEGWMR
ncbi:MAG TPA: conjugal transfer protein TraF, partial [Acidimicrobiales bacterium]|nr:conjugal transfer protein TraF [Acidimicrobiales bacterium]